MGNNIKVHVTGHAGTGVSTVSAIIEEALGAHGISVNVDGLDGNNVHQKVKETLPERVQSLRHKELSVNVNVVEVQAARRASTTRNGY